MLLRLIKGGLLLFPLLLIFKSSWGQIDTICSNNLVRTYHVRGEPASTFFWDAGDAGEIISERGKDSITIRWKNSSGLYRLSVIETNDLGCSGEPRSLDIFILHPEIKLEGIPICNFDDNTYSFLFNANGDKIVASHGKLSSLGGGQWRLSGVPVGNNVRLTLAIGECSTFMDVSEPDCKCPEPPPSVSLVSDKLNICKGERVNFTALPVNAGGSPLFYWKLNGRQIDNSSSTYSSDTIKSGDIITVEIVSSLNCAKGLRAQSNSIKLIVNEPKVVSITISASTNILCPGKSIIFTAKAVNAGFNPVYQWRVNGKKRGTNNPKFIAPWLKNNDVVECLFFSNRPCVSGSPAISNAIRVFSAPVAGNVFVPYNQVCSGTEVSMTLKGNTGPIQWQSSESLPSYKSILGADKNTYTEKIYQRKYFRAITQFAACPDSSKWTEINVYSPPVADYLYSRNGRDAAFKDNSSSDVIYREWNFGDNSPLKVNEINPFHTFDTEATYNVCLVVKNYNDCADTACKNIDFPTSLKNLKNYDTINIFPNPVGNILTLNVPDVKLKPELADIYDIIGREIYSTRLNQTDSNNYEINLSSLPDGIYLLKVEFGKSFFIKRFVKK